MNIKELYLAAKKEFADLIDVEQQDFRLEEAEFDRKEGVWELVVSYLVINKNLSMLELTTGAFPRLKYERIYKRLKFNEQKEFLGFYMYDH